MTNSVFIHQINLSKILSLKIQLSNLFYIFFKSINIGNFHISHTIQNYWFRKNSRLINFKRYSWSYCICSTNRSYYLPYFRFWIFYLWRKSKIGSAFLLLFLNPTTIIFHEFSFHKRDLLLNLGLIVGLIITAFREPI